MSTSRAVHEDNGRASGHTTERIEVVLKILTSSTGVGIITGETVNNAGDELGTDNRRAALEDKSHGSDKAIRVQDDPDKSPAAESDEQERADEDTYESLYGQYLDCVCCDGFGETSGRKILSCGHAWCGSCIETNVKISLQNRMDFPPKCCDETVFDTEGLIEYLSEETASRWLAVKEEFSDPTPIYCGDQRCSKYLSSSMLGDSEGSKWVVCTDCKAGTCTTCSQAEVVHTNDDECPDQLDKPGRALVEQAGWRACPSCRHMIQKIDGCNYIACVCGSLFCYDCGAETCICTYDEDDEQRQEQLQ